MSWKKQNNSERDSVCKSTFGETWIFESRIRFEDAIPIKCTLVPESALCFLQRFWQLLSTGDHNRLIANHFWRASCNKTHILTLVSSPLERLRSYDYLGQHDSCLLFLYAYLFSLQLDLRCRLSVQPLAIQMITLLTPSHSSMLDVSLLTHLWAGSDHSKPNRAHWISEGSIHLKVALNLIHWCLVKKKNHTRNTVKVNLNMAAVINSYTTFKWILSTLFRLHLKLNHD